ncbi:hypothetical protein JJD41_18095 [Oxynema sp. CENA135]|nr:hypothetical protein [Oxynema sp. CENA135]
MKGKGLEGFDPCPIPAAHGKRYSLREATPKELGAAWRSPWRLWTRRLKSSPFCEYRRLKAGDCGCRFAAIAVPRIAPGETGVNLHAQSKKTSERDRDRAAIAAQVSYSSG